MIFSYRSDYMAQVLSVVGEHGINGMEYNGLIASWPGLSQQFASRKLRWSLIGAKQFSGDEFENYLILAWRFGFVERTKYKEVDWKYGKNKASYEVENEIVRLTREGWEFIEKHDQPLLHRWAKNVTENLPTVVISALAAIAISWVAFVFGAPTK